MPDTQQNEARAMTDTIQYPTFDEIEVGQHFYVIGGGEPLLRRVLRVNPPPEDDEVFVLYPDGTIAPFGDSVRVVPAEPGQSYDEALEALRVAQKPQIPEPVPGTALRVQ